MPLALEDFDSNYISRHYELRIPEVLSAGRAYLGEHVGRALHAEDWPKPHGRGLNAARKVQLTDTW